MNTRRYQQYQPIPDAEKKAILEQRILSTIPIDNPMPYKSDVTGEPTGYAPQHKIVTTQELKRLMKKEVVYQCNVDSTGSRLEFPSLKVCVKM